MPTDVVQQVGTYLAPFDSMRWAHHVCAAWRREHRHPPTRDALCSAFLHQYAPGSTRMLHCTARRLASVVLLKHEAPKGRRFWVGAGVVHVHMDATQEAAVVVTEQGTVVPICMRRALQFAPIDVLINGMLGHAVVSAQSHGSSSVIAGCSRGALCMDVSNPLVPRPHWHTRGVARGKVSCVDLHDMLAIDNRKVLWRVDLLDNKMECIARSATAAVHAGDGNIVVATGELLWVRHGMLKRMPFKVRGLQCVDDTTLLVEGSHVHALVKLPSLDVVSLRRAATAVLMPSGDVMPAHMQLSIKGSFAMAWCRRQTWVTLL